MQDGYKVSTRCGRLGERFERNVNGLGIIYKKLVVDGRPQARTGTLGAISPLTQSMDRDSDADVGPRKALWLMEASKCVHGVDQPDPGFGRS